MKLIKLLPLAVLSIMSIGVHNFPAQAQSSEWEQAQVGDGYSSASCVPTMSLSSGTDDCGNPLTSEPSETEGDKDEGSEGDKDEGSLKQHIYRVIKGVVEDAPANGVDPVKNAGTLLNRCQKCHEPADM